MKREFLEQLGISKELADTIMAENGRGIEMLKSKNTTLSLEVEALKKALLKQNELEEQNKNLLSELSKKETAFESFVGNIIFKTAREAGFSSRSAENTAISLMKAAAQKGDDIFSVISELRESDPDAFSSGKEKKPIFSVPSNGSAEEDYIPKFSYLRRH